MRKIVILLCLALLLPALPGCGNSEETESAINSVLDPGTPEYTMPEEIEVRSIEENKVQVHNSESARAELVLDDAFLNRYIDMSEFTALKSWVLSQMDAAKSEFIINEAEYDALAAEMEAVGNTIATMDDAQAKKDALYDALSETDAAISLQMDEFQAQYFTDTGIQEESESVEEATEKENTSLSLLSDNQN